MNHNDSLNRTNLNERLRALETQEALMRKSASPPDFALRDSEERLRAILETAVEGIITIDEFGTVESVNPAAERTFGYMASELIGKNVNVLMPSPYHENHDQYLKNYVRTGHAKIIGIGREVIGQRKDGSTFPMDLSVSEVRLAHKRLFTGFVRDITERKQLHREISEASEMEQRRIGQDLHDGICQQLAGIELMSEVLEQNLEKKSATHAAQAGEIARHVRDAIAQTRSLARGLSPVVLESEGLMIALQQLAENTSQIFRVTCRFICPQPILISDNTAATHLFRIAQEAVSNGIRHGKAKELKVSLVTLNGKIRLTIKDNGIGFKTSSSGDNEGLGLRIMQYRAGMTGGTLTLESDRNGTSVVCTAPFPVSQNSK